MLKKREHKYVYVKKVLSCYQKLNKSKNRVNLRESKYIFGLNVYSR